MKKVILVCAAAILISGCDKDMAQVERGNPAARKKVLIAGSVSPFKEAVLEKTLSSLGNEYSVKVTGLAALEKADTAQYGAVVVIATIMAGKLSPAADAFVARNKTNPALIVVSTWGEDNGATNFLKAPSYKLDSVTSASKGERTGATADKLTSLIMSRF